MASIIKIGECWRAQVRKIGHKSISKTFRTKAEAVRWAVEVGGILEQFYRPDRGGADQRVLDYAEGFGAADRR